MTFCFAAYQIAKKKAYGMHCKERVLPVTTEMDKPCPIWKFTADNQAKIGLQGIGFQYAVSYHPVQLLDLVCKKLPSQNFHLFPI